MTVSRTREGRIIRPRQEGREQRSQALGTGEPGLGNRRTRLWEQENQALRMEVPDLGNSRLDRLVFPTSAPGSGLKSRSRTDIVIFWLRSRNPGSRQVQSESGEHLHLKP